MPGRELGRALVSEFGGGCDHPGMVDQGIAEPDPQLGITGMFAHRRTQDARRVGALAPTRHRFRHQQPMLGSGEISEECMAHCGERYSFVRCGGQARRSGQARAALQRIARRAEEQRRSGQLEHRTAQT